MDKRPSQTKRLLKRHAQGKHNGWQGPDTNCPICMTRKKTTVNIVPVIPAGQRFNEAKIITTT